MTSKKMQILKFLIDQNEWLSPSTIIEKSKFKKGTVYRSLSQLSKQKFVKSKPNGRCTLYFPIFRNIREFLPDLEEKNEVIKSHNLKVHYKFAKDALEGGYEARLNDDEEAQQTREFLSYYLDPPIENLEKYSPKKKASRRITGKLDFSIDPENNPNQRTITFYVSWGDRTMRNNDDHATLFLEIACSKESMQFLDLLDYIAYELQTSFNLNPNDPTIFIRQLGINKDTSFTKFREDVRLQLNSTNITIQQAKGSYLELYPKEDSNEEAYFREGTHLTPDELTFSSALRILNDMDEASLLANNLEDILDKMSRVEISNRQLSKLIILLIQQHNKQLPEQDQNKMNNLTKKDRKDLNVRDPTKRDPTYV